VPKDRNEAYGELKKALAKPHRQHQQSTVSLEELSSLFDEYQDQGKNGAADSLPRDVNTNAAIFPKGAPGASTNPVSRPRHQQQQSLVSLEELHSLFDEYQDPGKNGPEDSLPREESTNGAEFPKEASGASKILEARPYHQQQLSLVPLNQLHNGFDGYQVTHQEATLGLENIELINSQPQLLLGLEIRSTKSSKKRQKRHVHIKKRALVKVKSEKIKYDISYLEKGSHHDKLLHHRSLSRSSNGQHCSLVMSNSLDGIISNAHDAIEGRENCNESVEHVTPEVYNELFSPKDYREFFSPNPPFTTANGATLAETDIGIPAIERSSSTEVASKIERTSQFADEEDSSVESVTPADYKELVSAKATSLTITRRNDHISVPALEEPGSTTDEDGHSLATSTVSLDTFASAAYVDSFGTDEEYDNSEKNGKKADIAHSQSSSRLPEIQKGTSFIFTKLYEENIELAEALSAAQSELQKVSRQMEQVVRERDEIIATARFEI